MYTRFFGLNEKPFSITPDPRYLFMSERHGEGLAHLVYGVTESGGFIQLTGEVGTGKTTLVRTLLGKLPEEVDIALILNPQVTVLEFLQLICQELAVPLPEEKDSAMALVEALNRYLLDAHSRGRRTILLVDEAQNLSDEVLEQLRLLTNLETAKQKLLQIILIGQPELRLVLAKNHLRQLAQRVTGRYHLEPLSRNEATRYIEHRLKVAGGVGEIFDARAKRDVHRLARGIPRVMNVICDRALLGAYGQETRKVNSKLVKRAAMEVSGQRSSSPSLKWVAAILAVAAVALIGADLWPPGGIQEPLPPITTAERTESVVESPTAVPITSAAEELSALAPTSASAMPPPSLEPLLASGSLEATGQQSMSQLLSLWGLDSNTVYNCAQITSLGLSCLAQRGSWNLLRQLDRPAILTLVDGNGSSYKPLLVALNDASVELVFNGDRQLFARADVAALWFGQYLLVWQPPNGSAGSIAPGMRNINVLWLRESLAKLGGGPQSVSEDPEFFDAELETQLRDFQRQNRLQVDGLAGQQTQILINSMLKPAGRPRLSAGG